MSLAAKPKRYTLDEYLNLETTTEYFYELEAGTITEMPPESPENVRVAMYLMMLLMQQLGVERVSNKAEIIISGTRVNSRIPDITVFTPEGVAEIRGLKRSTVTLDMLPPLLVVEVVSPGKENRDRDYRFKRSEYAARGIPFYWIVDPQLQCFTALTLVDGLYEETIVNSLNLAEKDNRISIADPIKLDINLGDLFAL